MNKRAGIGLCICFMMAAVGVQAEEVLIPIEISEEAEENLISVNDSEAAEENLIAVEDSETAEEILLLNGANTAVIQKIAGGAYVSVEYPMLDQSAAVQVYEYADEVNQKFEDAAQTAVEEEKAVMDEIYDELVESGNDEMAQNLCYETTCGSVYLLGSAYSVMQSHYTYTGGAHPYYWVTGVTYDLNTGKEMTMGEILGCDEATAKEAVVLAYWENIIGQVEYITEESIRESFDAMEYWFDEEGMRVSLAPYIVASYAAGPQDVLVTQEHVAQAR